MKKFIHHCLMAMKTTALLLLLAAFMLTNNPLKAQQTDVCVIDSNVLIFELDSVAKLTASSINGAVFTPRGEMRVLIIYAGFTNDNVKTGGYNPHTQILDTSVTWPYYDLNGDSLNTFPKNTWDLFYNDYSNFSATNTDKSISNFYYQMSLPSGNPFKMIAGVFPERINVTATSAINLATNPNAWATYTNMVYDYIRTNYPGYDFSPYDSRTNMPGYQYDYSGYAPDGKIDYVIVIWRYNKSCPLDPGGASTLCGNTYSGGSVASSHSPLPSSPLNSLGTGNYYINAGFTTQKGFWGIDPTTFTHEVAHTLYGAPHCNGANGVVGSHFYGNYGWGMMRSSLAPNVYSCANGWERWYNGWIELTTGSGNTPSDVATINDLQNGGVYTLRDFITTGDVIRVKLPNVSNQFLWLENHTGENIFDDRYSYETNGLGVPFPEAPRGLVGYIENTRYARSYTAGTSVGGNSIKYLNANGNFDFTNQYANPEPTAPEWWGGIAYDFQKSLSNPLAGQNQLTQIRNDFNGNSTIINYNNNWNNPGSSNEMRDLIKQDNSFTYGTLGFGMNFPQGAKVDLGSNPVITNLQLYDSTTKQLAPNYLNGISFEVLSYNGDNSVTVKIRMDDYDVNNNTRYTGDIILSPNVVSSANYSLNLKAAKTLDIDKSGTPNRHTLSPDNDFINPTLLTCNSGSYFHLEANATVNVINGSTLKLTNGSKMELEAGATLHIAANSSLIIENGAELNLKPGANLIIDAGATVTYKNSTANKGLLIGTSIYTGIPAVVEVSGNITFTSTAQWIHNRDGFYRFYPTHSLTIPATVPVKFTGKGKTFKFVELANNTTINLSGINDMDWNNGLVYYGSNAKIMLNDVDFTSINTTYNSTINPQTTSTAVELNNPRTTFFNSCNFNNLNKGVVVDGGTSLVHIQSGKLTNMTTYGVELNNVGNFKMTNGFIDGAATCLYAQNSNSTSTILEINGTELKNAMYGAELYEIAGAYFSSSANIHDHTVGIKANMSLVFLRNGASVHTTSLYGVEIYGSYDVGMGNYNAMLTMGDVGCGSVYNNQNYGIFGVDALLNIDAVQHAIDRGDNIVKPNRFDNNAYMTFEMCYSSSAVAPSQINAKGNFWGIYPPDIQPNQYTFVANICAASGGTPVYIPLIHTNYSTCIPINSCMECGSNGGGVPPSPVPGLIDIQASFTNANILFVEEDNIITRTGFSDISAVELIKDTLTDTWKTQTTNNEQVDLAKEIVHLVQVSKAIKATVNNSNARMIQLVDDVLKDIKPEKLGLTSTVTLYPNPTNDKLFVDVEKEDNYKLIIYNISSQKVVEQILTDKHNLVNLNKLPDGMYFYELSAPNSNTLKGNIIITK